MSKNDEVNSIHHFLDVLEWYEENSLFGTSRLGIHLARTFSEAALLAKPVPLKHLYSTTRHSHAAIRKSVGELVDKGLVSVHCSSSDRRSKYLKLSKRFQEFMREYAVRVRSINFL